MQNPFTHTFGMDPIQYISTLQTEEITKVLLSKRDSC
jgi:hypothetical protein